MAPQWLHFAEACLPVNNAFPVADVCLVILAPDWALPAEDDAALSDDVDTLRFDADLVTVDSLWVLVTSFTTEAGAAAGLLSRRTRLEDPGVGNLERSRFFP